MRKIIVLLLMAVITGSVQGQETQKQLPINISYFGHSILHPGIEAGYENNFWGPFNFTVSIGTYVHQRNHTAAFLNAGINWRHTFPIGYSMEFGLGLGYLHTWQHGGPIYTVDDNGNVNKEIAIGRPSLMPSLKLGLLGWDFRKKTSIPLRINVDAIAFGQYPYNNFIMPRFALKAGATYYFDIPAGGNSK